jgi:LuxR family transcriptional regulator
VLERAKNLLSSEHFSVDETLIRAWASGKDIVHAKGAAQSSTSHPRLTAREIEVLRWTAHGKTVDEISVLLAISVNTVNFHIKNAVAKLHAANKTAAAVRAAMLGLLERRAAARIPGAAPHSPAGA